MLRNCAKLFARATELLASCGVRYVSGHSGHPSNEMCDSLACHRRGILLMSARGRGNEEEVRSSEDTTLAAGAFFFEKNKASKLLSHRLLCSWVGTPQCLGVSHQLHGVSVRVNENTLGLQCKHCRRWSVQTSRERDPFGLSCVECVFLSRLHDPLCGKTCRYPR